MSDAPNLRRMPWRTHDWDSLPKPRLSISEVAELFGVEEYTLRYWEQETRLSPSRFTGSGARYYVKKDLLILEKLYYFIEVKGLTVKAADRALDEADMETEIEIRDRLLAVREKLVSLRDRLERYASDTTETE